MEKLDVKDLQGLSEKEAEKRLNEDGYNELPSQKEQSVLFILFNVCKEPMLLLLLGAGLIYFFLGEVKDALMLLTFVFVVIGITFYQERKTEKALAALKNLSSPRALVIRGGEQIRIAGREVVRDDIIILREGDRVPADAYVLESVNLTVDQSLLTGESLSVAKSLWDGKEKFPLPGGDHLPAVYSGTLVVAGRGVARVVYTGINTQMGKIGKALETIKDEDTLLQKEITKMVRNFTIVGLFLCIIVVVVYGLTRGDYLKGLLSGLTLSMSILPEEFPVILLIFMTLGAWRMSKRKVLTRKTAAIETLGATTVLCVDKTGTITLNRMKLEALYAGSKSFNLTDKNIPESFHPLLEYSMLASQKDPFDPIEREVKDTGERLLTGTEHIHKNWKLIKEYPLSKKHLALSHVWQSPDEKDYVIAAKGAPEAIADLCHFTKKETEELLREVTQMSTRGLRVLAVAKAAFVKTSLPDQQHDFPFEYIGLLGFKDPVRATAGEAIKEAYRAGIRVIMITGDFPGTAEYIGHEIGLKNPENYITGQELAQMNHMTLREKIKSVNIFARVIPEQKLSIVNALKANGEIVAMTGDGVNDAPALKSAHIGIAMGERGTDVAREASDIVLLNDDFYSIVAAVRLGRRIFDNLKKAMTYIFAIHVPIAGMSLLPVIFNLPLVLLPAHIAFLELIIDPASSTVFEAISEEGDIMDRKPRNLREPMFDKKSFIFSILQGFSVLLFVFIVYILALNKGEGEAEARSLTFVTLVFSNLMLIMTNISWKNNIVEVINSKNKALFLVVGGALISLILILYVPFLRSLFHFSVLGITDLFITFIVGIISVFWFESLKFIAGKKIFS
ncbi:MAG: Cation transport ATPase [Candidatus Gottesmanbacteria bacterium GW2011_GWC2_39_8]|uniref:Cation transport ATPase n=1 Tax=Candidatus Gottesmanbacteria bacterium GW2011_GWC2_39_8 TaxID=1618450 RepID=A0A0G0SBP1_9BACT|nr:MAG: Cation transport ATPase [Candidatus Gottesmanbacteria bacterium GW2011_GWC2_39_8]